ncbi:hypothetical protein FRX31_010033 [Thalictrum thalictroides]|uniref:Serine-rich protein-like protein n=1 Tax=Thalictrum thalictroides TaxID=46969 RepID=A0A7J6WSM2_THATH|nr:hypothetical protein FRX31_010033 [Thalictrum thalictroides]
MTSRPGTIDVATSPKTAGGKGESTMISPKGGGQCLCSPTTHNGSFRCRFHRSLSSTWMMRRSKSMPPRNSTTATVISPKSVEST